MSSTNPSKKQEKMGWSQASGKWDEEIAPIYPTAVYSRPAAAAVTGLSIGTLRRAEQTGKLKASKASDSFQAGRVVYTGMALLEFLGVPEVVINTAIAALLVPAKKREENPA